MTTPRHDPGCSFAGKGLWRMLKLWRLRLNSTFETNSAQSPVLQIETVFCAMPQSTSPKYVDPYTDKCPDGVNPETFTRCGPAGSLLKTVMVAVAAPSLVGAKVIGTSIAVPGAMVSGKTSTDGRTNSGEDDVIAVISRVQPPAFASPSGLSAKECRHTFPNLPLSAKMVTRRGAGEKPTKSMIAGLAGSSLAIVICPEAGPVAVGAKRIGISMPSPAPITSGKNKTVGGWNAVDEVVIEKMVRLQGPLLFSPRERSRNEPTHTFPKSPLSGTTTSSEPFPSKPVAVTSKSGVLGSFETMRMVADSGPGVVGVNSIVKSTSLPGAIVSGVAGFGRTLKSVDPAIHATLSTIRSALPTL